MPVVVLNDFGVDDSLINTVFAGSGCLGDLDDVRAGRAFTPDPTWLLDNYFHPVGEDDLVERVSDLVRRRDSGSAPAAETPLDRRGVAPGETARLVLPTSVLRQLRRIRTLAGDGSAQPAEPDGPGGEDQVTDLTDRAPSAGSGEHQPGGAQHRRDGRRRRRSASRPLPSPAGR